MHTYTARVIDNINNPPNEGRPTWRSIHVGVFRVENGTEEQVGEYIRIYPNLFNTFCYFRQGDKELALYSSDYTATRIMELPSCKDIGGEEPHTHGFCPTDFYVPTHIDQEYNSGDGHIRRHRVNNPGADALKPSSRKYTMQDKAGAEYEVEHTYTPLTPLLYYPFGFVAGCVWGDDSTWKIQHLDLSEAAKGILKRDDRFGYIAMPDKLALKDAIDMIDYMHDVYDVRDEDEPPCADIYIDVRKKYDLSTGNLLD